MEDLDMFNCLNDLWDVLQNECSEYYEDYPNDSYEKVLLLKEDIVGRLHEWNNFYNDITLGNFR